MKKNNTVSKTGKTLTRTYIYLMLIAFPLFTGFEGYRGITGAKLTFYVTAAFLFFALLLVLPSVRERRLILPRPLGKNSFSAVEICVLVYFVLVCVSALASPYGKSVILGAGRFDGLLQTAICVCIFMCVSRYGELESGYFYALAISMTACCAVALLQLLGLNPLWLFPNGYNYYDMGVKFSGEFLGTIGNANLFSAFLALCLPSVIGFYVIGKRSRAYLLPVIALGAFCLFECTVSAGKLALALCLLFAAPLLASDTKKLRRLLTAGEALCAALAVSEGFWGRRADGGAEIGFALSEKTLYPLVAAALFLCAAAFLKNLRLSRRACRGFVLASSILIAAAALVFVYGYSGENEALGEISDALHGEVKDSYGSSRIMIWRDCLALVSERPILGGGPGTASLRLDINFSRLVEETGKTLSSRVDNAHNVYLGILMDTGIISLLAYLAAVSLTLIKAARAKTERPLAQALCCGLLCYLIQDFFGLGLFLVSPLMWIALALVPVPIGGKRRMGGDFSEGPR